MSDFLSFHLAEDFIQGYANKPIPWGFQVGGGNSLGELAFVSKYSRLKEDGTKEQWHEVVERCINGYYSILKNHCKSRKTAWNEFKAQQSAKDAYERMFTFKWLPPGRGIWSMGTRFVNEKGLSESLQNCAVVSTEKLSAHSAKEATFPFVRLMEMSMVGIGVGFDTRGANKLELHQPTGEPVNFTIPDSREGWCESLGKLLETYFFKNRQPITFNYTEIRAAGEPIKGFGGIAPGHTPLKALHEGIVSILGEREGQQLTSTDIVDIMNMAGKCVVAGGIRRTAEIAFGSAQDEAFLDLKDYSKNPKRMGPDGWGFASNNSILAQSGTDYSAIAERIANNGEPGFMWLDVARKYGRLVDPVNNKDWRVVACNPCGEQPLESGECCTLVETFPFHHDSVEDYKQTLKHAYLYGKAVTLLPTSWPETNEVMNRNHRIGCSMSGVAQFAEARGWGELREWMDEGYNFIQHRDEKYSEWLGVRESIKTTSIKPSGTVSLLANATPGIHWPVASDFYIRRMRYSVNDMAVAELKKAGYHVEPDVMDPEHTCVVEFPTEGSHVRSEKDVSMWEKAELAVLAQRWWSDNMVSVTVTFNEQEKEQIPALLRSKDGQLKSLSMLPLFDDGSSTYAQMPYEAITKEQYDKMVKKVKPINWEKIYSNGSDAAGEAYCDNDSCTI